MKKLCIVFIFLAFTFSLSSSPYEMILVGDPVLEDLRFLSLESGLSILSFTPPFPPHELELFLNSLDTSTLSSPALEAYNRIRERLIPRVSLKLFESDNFLLGINIISTLEFRGRSNDNISWYPQYPRVPSFLNFPLRFFFMDSLMLYVEPQLTMKTAHYIEKSHPFALNTAYEYQTLDFFMPFRAFITTGGSWWNFQLGRDRLSFGSGQMGNLAISDNPDFYEFMRVSLFSKYLKYTSLTAQMPFEVNESFFSESLLNHDEFDLDKANFNRTMQRYLYLHRLDFNFFDKFSFGAMEGVMVGNAPLELRYLNPLMIFHSFFSWNNYDPWLGTVEEASDWGSVIGSLFSLEANFSIFKSLSIYGQFVMNEFATAQEREENSNQPPNGIGYMAGIRYSHSFNVWASSFFFEFTSTDAYLYLNPSPFASYIQMRYTPEPSYAFTGYPRDLIIYTLGGRFFKNDIMSFSGVFSLLLNGERDMIYDWEISPRAGNEKNPSGIAEEKFIGTLSAEWKFHPMFNIKGSLTGIVSRNNRHVIGSNETGFQSTLSLSFTY